MLILVPSLPRTFSQHAASSHDQSLLKLKLGSSEVLLGLYDRLAMPSPLDDKHSVSTTTQEFDEELEKLPAIRVLPIGGIVGDVSSTPRRPPGLIILWKTLKRYALKLWPHAVIDEPRTWQQSWVRFGPLSGLLSLIIAATSMVVALGLLVGADGQDVEGWLAPPSTYLALCTSVANLSVRYAAMQGVIIAWWRRASEGSTLQKLQSDWRSGTSIRGAVTAGRAMGLLGLACIFATTVEIGGPLLQRASTAHGLSRPTTISLDVVMAPELPTGWSGVWFTTSDYPLPNYYANPAFNATYPSADGWLENNIICQQGGWSPDGQLGNAPTQWWDNAPAKGVVRGCAGTCTAKIQAPALFPTSCETRTVISQLDSPYDAAAANGEFAPPLTSEGYISTTSLLVQEPRITEGINLITGFVTLNSSCEGEFVYKTCTFEPGIGEYEIVIQNDEVDMVSLAAPSFVALANNSGISRSPTTVNGGTYRSTLAGVVYSMMSRWNSYEAFYPTFPDGKTVYGTIGIYQSQPMMKYQGNSTCASLPDPYDGMVSSLNKLMFYLGSQAATTLDASYLHATLDPGLSVNSTTVGQTQETVTVYRTDYWYFWGAASAVLVSIAFILPTYWGWSRLGRPVSLSPLETAKVSGIHTNLFPGTRLTKIMSGFPIALVRGLQFEFQRP